MPMELLSGDVERVVDAGVGCQTYDSILAT